MQSKMYIPTDLVIGFQKRSDTFTGKLAYVIYKDHKGVLRKEASWNNWRDKKIEPLTITNVPTSGFTLNKGVQRDGYWGNGRSVIRVWDPRDFEFEISVPNLMGVLMHSDVSKRDITESCVFAWHGTELVLLPTNSLEYQESVTYTEAQTKQFSAKDLVVGHVYQPKSGGEQVVYLGRHKRYEMEHTYESETFRTIVKNKGNLQHTFIGIASRNNVYFKSPPSFISSVVQEDIHSNFANLMDIFYHKSCSQKVINCMLEPILQRTVSYWTGRFFVKLDTNRFILVGFKDVHGKGVPRAYAISYYEWDDDNKLLKRTRINNQAPHTYNYYRVLSTYTTPQQVKGLQEFLQSIDTSLLSNLLPDTPNNLTDVEKQISVLYEPIDIQNIIDKVMYGTFGAGELVFILEDGKVCTDYKLT